MTITAADYGALGAVTETLPAGFGCVSSGLDDEEVQATGQHLRFTRQGDSPSRYIVNAPTSQDLQLRRAGVPRDHIHPSSRDPTKSTIDNAIALRKGLDRHHNATAV